MDFIVLSLDHSECDRDNTWEALDDNVMDDPEDEMLDALDEYFDSQADNVTLDAPESKIPNSTEMLWELLRHLLQVQVGPITA